MRSIRSFLNLDTPDLAKIWHLHHRAYGSKSDCTVVAWDHAVLAKPFFRNEQLLMAEDSSEGMVGFAHWGKNPEAQCVGKDVGILHRLCVRPGEDEDAIASELIEASLQAMKLEGHDRCVGIGAFDDSIFYIGVADGDGYLARPWAWRLVAERGLWALRSVDVSACVQNQADGRAAAYDLDPGGFRSWCGVLDRSHEPLCGRIGLVQRRSADRAVDLFDIGMFAAFADRAQADGSGRDRSEHSSACADLAAIGI
ncbi:MAG: hypothetical protein LW720_13810 [Pirellula sp.]|nr:hypothetical protein [Pirellula sp.]